MKNDGFIAFVVIYGDLVSHKWVSSLNILVEGQK